MNLLTKHRPLFRDTDLWGFPSRLFDMPAMFNEGNTPRVNIRETDKSYEVEAAVPGYKKEDLKVTVDQGMLTISCHREEERTDDDENDGYARREFYSRSFTRSLILPEAADEENVNARYDQGVLRLTIPKRKDAGTKKGKEIKIN